MKKFIVTACIIFTTFLFVNFANAKEAILFYGDGCPHCTQVEKWMEDKELTITIVAKEVYFNKENQQEFNNYCDQKNITSRGVPLLALDDEYVVGGTPIIAYLEKYTADSAESVNFSDIANYNWKNSIEYIQAKNIINGYADGTFKPNNKINRAELTKMVLIAKYGEIAESYSQDCFSDVKKDDWYAKYTCFAKEKNILKGYSDGSFGVGKNITQPEALKIIFNAFGESITEDQNQWYQSYLDYAQQIGMYYFQKQNAPNYELTRGEFSYFMAWIMTKENSSERQNVNQITNF